MRYLVIGRIRYFFLYIFLKNNSIRAFGPLRGAWHASRNPSRFQGDGSVNRPGPRIMYMCSALSRLSEDIGEKEFRVVYIVCFSPALSVLYEQGLVECFPGVRLPCA